MKRWIASEVSVSAEAVRALATAEGILEPIAHMVLRRTGGDFDAALRFLRPQLKFLRPPMDLPDMDLAVQRAAKALENNEAIGVHGDYDVDGTVSVALIVSTLKAWGGNVMGFIPERSIDGYGLSKRGMQECKSKGVTLLITCDCGIAAHDEVEYARELGLDVIITDHHMLSRPEVPKALAVVNPQRPESRYAFNGICGAGVAFCFLVALRATLRERGYFAAHGLPDADLRETLDLVAIATLADSVPLIDDNRILVAKGLQVLTQTKRPGLRALLEATGLAGKKLTTWDIVFKIVPRLNVAGRMGKSAMALEILLCTDEARAIVLTAELEVLNTERRRIEGEVRAQAIEQIERGGMLSRRALVLASDTWHRGVIGIVASKLSERFGRPTAIIALGEAEGTGSVRGVSGVNLVEAMNHCKDHLLRHGGHRMAAGLTIARNSVDSFREAFVAFIETAVSEDDLHPSIELESDLMLSVLSKEWLDQLELLQPFGEANPEPVFASYGVDVQSARIVGETHLKLSVGQAGARRDAIGFGFGEHFQNLGKTIDIAFTPRWNEFRGQRSIQLEIKDLR